MLLNFDWHRNIWMAGTGWRVSVLQIKTLPAIKSRIHIALYIHLSINPSWLWWLSWLSCYLIAHLISGTVWFDRRLHISCNQTSQTFQGLLRSSFIVMGSITALSHPFTITTLAAFFAATADSVAKQGKPTRGESTCPVCTATLLKNQSLTSKTARILKIQKRSFKNIEI